MADLEARREARRRKILENSEKRLNKISGVEQKTTKTELDGINKICTHDEANSIYIEQSKGLNDERISSNPFSTELSSQAGTYHQNIRTDDGRLIHNTQGINRDGKSLKNTYIFVIPIVLSFTLVMFELLQIDVRFIHLNKIFIPLLIYELTQYFFTNSLGDLTPNFLVSLLLLTNIKNRFITLYINYFLYFFKVMQDVMVYFFIFTVSYEILLFVLL